MAATRTKIVRVWRMTPPGEWEKNVEASRFHTMRQTSGLHHVYPPFASLGG